jgi:transcriptional regulator with XRE-family HTH domain
LRGKENPDSLEIIPMEGYTPNNAQLSMKIARLVEEKGWNQEDFARIASVNRHTARRIMHGQDHRLRNATINQCAAAFGLQVSELRSLPVEALLERIRTPANGSSLVIPATIDHPDLKQWLEQHPDRAAALTREEMNELLSMQAIKGGFSHISVDQFVQMLERRRKVLAQVRVVASSDQLPLLEQIVEMMFERVQNRSLAASRES